MKNKIKKDMFKAMKEKNSLKKNTLQLVLSAITNKEKELKRKLDENEILSVIQKEVKQTNDVKEMSIKANRNDLVEEANNRIKILKKYLPEQLSNDEIKIMVETIIKDVNATSIGDIGKIMGIIIPKIKGKADGSVVNKIVIDKLKSL
ncbi:MAG: GatB/YqeY domain-containing protein [bacterium]